MSSREVVITGLGLTTPLGKNVEQSFSAMKSMNTGITRIPSEGLPPFMQYAAPVREHSLPDDIPPKQMGQMKFLNRGAVLGFCSASEAMDGAEEIISGTEPGRRALYVASGDFTSIGSEFMYPAVKEVLGSELGGADTAKLNASAMQKVNPFFLLNSLHNNLFSFLSAYREFMGSGTSLASLSPCGGNALELAHRAIKLDSADIALAVGYGSWINELALYELEGLGILSKCSSGASSFRPFDRGRDGFIPGEGGAAILLEEAEAAQKRGARIFGRVRGFGNCTEFSSTRALNVPEKVIKRNIALVLEHTGCGADDLAFIIPHGSATKKGDRSELRSLMEILGDNKDAVPICGLKPYTGHMGAASDIAEVIFGLNALSEKTVPSTMNFRSAEKEFSCLKISASPQECRRNSFLSVSYGVGGQSSSVIVEIL